VLGLWRHARRHWPVSYDPALWSVVFPLGVYSVATLSFGNAAHLGFMESLSRFMLWVAVAAWAMVAVAFLARLARRSGDPTSGAPAASARPTTTRLDRDQPGQPASRTPRNRAARALAPVRAPKIARPIVLWARACRNAVIPEMPTTASLMISVAR